MSTLTRPRTDVCLIATLVAIAACVCESSAQAQTAPAVPGSLKVTARSESSLSLRWKDRSRSEAYYKVRVARRARRVTANRQTVTVTGLQPGVTYRIAVQACARPGRCSKAATTTATTTSARPVPDPSAAPGPRTATGVTAPSPPAAPATSVELTGTVSVITGNCMPAIGGKNKSCQTSPAAGARVLLYGPVLKHHVDMPGSFYAGPRLPSAETTTNATGRYHVVVEPGTYSFLADVGSGPECGTSDADWSACPHTLLAPTQTVDLKIDHAAW